MNASGHWSGTRLGRSVLVGLLSLLASCGGGDDTPPAPPLPDLAGVWAGTWQGMDPVLGQVGGTWEAVFTQSGTSLSGPVTLLGDVDCMFGQASGAIDAQNHLSGTLLRAPCQLNQWMLTALDPAALAGTGAWSQSGSGAAGSLGGQRVARLTGPRVLSVHPPAGAPGTVVTIAGTSLAPGAASPVLRFGDVQQPAPLSTSATRWVARVPAGATTGAVQLTTPDGSAGGPVMFRAEVATPSLALAWSLASAEAPSALAFSRDGRKLFVAERGTAGGGIAVVHTLKSQQLTRTAITGGRPIALATSPDGRRLYASAAGSGVLVLDAALAVVADTIAVPIGDAVFDNPQGLAVSPDGALLLVSDGLVDGHAALLRTADKVLARQWPVPAGSVPLGVAFSADGNQALVLAAPVAGGSGALLRFDVASGAALAPIAVGSRPVGVAVSPDGRTAFVTNQGDHSLSRVDLASALVTATVPAGQAPSGVAFSPDGSAVLVANRDDYTLTLHGAADGWPVAAALGLSGSPLGVAIDPQGMTAFAGVGSARMIQAIGGARSLNVLLSGTGFGTVTSEPAGIRCGTSCLARFVAGTTVRLTAAPGTNSRFAGWSGDAACGSGTVTLITDTACVASFVSNNPPPQSVPAGGPCFIATAAYGSTMAPQVQVLREFRDRHLLTHAAGRRLVAFYYRHSPAWADAIRPHAGARAAVRALLWPVVFAIEHPGAAAGLAFAAIGALGWGLTRRRNRPAT